MRNAGPDQPRRPPGKGIAQTTGAVQASALNPLPLSTELLILVSLVVANGLLSMAETGVVASRKAKLQEWADDGDASAGRALALKEHPQRFLALVQFWLTLSGMIAGVLGGARLAGKLDAWMASHTPSWDAPGDSTSTAAFALVAIGLTSFMLLFGELVPKRIALAYPERVAAVLAGSMRALAWLAAPFLKILELATSAVLALIRFKPPVGAPEVSNDEVRALIEQGLHAGSFNQAEQQMVTGVLELDELSVTVLMTPRPKIVFLNLDDSDEVNWRKIVSSAHTNFPVYEGNRDQVIGMVSVKALWANAAIGLKNNLRDHLTAPLFVPETVSAVQVLETFQNTGKQLALVTDEFGTVQGIVTLYDVMRAIVGVLPQPGDRRRPPAVQREDGSWLVEGSLGIVEFKRRFSFGVLPGEDDDRYQSLGGFVVDRLGHIPNAGESFHWGGWRFEVVDMDRHRVDKVLLVQSPTQPAA